MSTFEETRSLPNQIHFTVVEIDLPVVTGTCTIGDKDGFGTPLSCDQPANGIQTYKFTNTDAPLLPESGIYRCIKSINETPAKLQTGKGLASRGTFSIVFNDFKGDPNPLSPAVLAGLALGDSYFTKFDSRNILQNKNVRIKNYRVEKDGSIDLVNGAQTRHYLVESFESSSKGTWKLSGKDELNQINIDESVWPLPLEGFLRQDINDATNTIPVDANVNYLIGDGLRIGDELMKVVGVADIGTPTATLTVQNRGTDIFYTNFISKTGRDEHEAGDEIFVCEVSDNERIDDLLKRILIDIGIDPMFIPDAEWASEIDEWHPLTRVNTFWYESEDTVAVLERILTYYMIDMWFDPVSRLIKISAISVWKESSQTIREGNQIDFESIKRKKKENLRATRAQIVYDKRFLSKSDSIENYNKVSLFRRTELETSELYGKPKTKRFDANAFIDKDGSDLLVNRYVNRFLDPKEFSWKTQEKKLDFQTGDIVDIISSVETGFDGLPTGQSRAQITSITPKYGKIGREYMVTALTYEPTFSQDTEIIIQGNIANVNLFNQYAGAPSQPVELTFILDGVTSSSTASNIASIRAGAFPAGSKIILILANGADLMARGGDGGNGGGIEPDQESGSFIFFPSPQNGEDGGTVIDAEGVDMDIYFSGATPSTNYPEADGFVRAPSGGAGGFNASAINQRSGNGGKGGDGRVFGLGGSAGVSNLLDTGDAGANGTDDTLTGVFGVDGADNNATGGLKGNGIVDNGGTVTLFGVTPERYINGGGDHP